MITKISPFISLVCLVAVVSSFHNHSRTQEAHKVSLHKLIEVRKDNIDLLRRMAVANELLAELFDEDPATFDLQAAIHYQTKITAYSLSPDECDSNPLQAAFGRSRPFMAALSRKLEATTGLRPGDRFAVLSDDGEIRAICIFWDRMSSRWPGCRLDIVAPAKEVAVWNGVKNGRLVKLSSQKG